MPHEKLQEFLKIDYEADMALVVLSSATEEDARMLAIAHYLKNPRTNLAETAFLVRDDWQGKGIGGKLMGALTETHSSKGSPASPPKFLPTTGACSRSSIVAATPSRATSRGTSYSLNIPFSQAESPR